MQRLLLLSFLLTSYFLNAQNDLNLHSDKWPPFTDVKGEKSVATDLVQTALKRIEHPGHTTIAEFDDILKQLQSGEVDGSVALWKTEEREQFLVYSKPYLQNQLILVGLKGKKVDFKKSEELAGSRLGLVKSYAYNKDLLDQKDITFIYSQSDQENLELLFDEKIDYLLVDQLLIQYLMKYQLNDVEELLSIANRPLEVKPLYFVLHKDVANAEEIMIAFNAEINKMIKDGTYHQILELNWVKADLDGDGVAELFLDGAHAGTRPPSNSYDLFYSDSTTHGDHAYHIEGETYDDWDSVPDKYKKNKQFNSTESQENFGGFKIKL